MKKILYTLIVILIVCQFSGCRGKKSDSGSLGSSDSAQVYAVCVWDNVSLKETPAESGKWLASLSLGEKCYYLDDKKEDNTGKKPVTYFKVQLMDKKEGWVRSEFIVLNSRPATLVRDAEIYSRPDLLTKTSKVFGTMDIVAIKSVQNDFIEVVGKRKEGKWIESGWIKSSNVTENDIDIAVAKFGSKALAITNLELRNKAINEIVNNSDFKNSVFIDYLSSTAENSVVTETPAEEEPVGTSDETPTETTQEAK
jgi:hypothetical protein